MGHARSACGRSSFGPGFDSPRLHSRAAQVAIQQRRPAMGAVVVFGASWSGEAATRVRRKGSHLFPRMPKYAAGLCNNCANGCAIHSRGKVLCHPGIAATTRAWKARMFTTIGAIFCMNCFTIGARRCLFATKKTIISAMLTFCGIVGSTPAWSIAPGICNSPDQSLSILA